MGEYRIFATAQFEKDVEALARSGQTAIQTKLHRFVYPRLRENPHFGPNIKKLKGYRPDTWRYRVGRWRFFYEIDDRRKIVFLIAASHRGSAY